MISDVDDDGSGTIGYEEFLSLCGGATRPPCPAFRRARRSPSRSLGDSTARKCDCSSRHCQLHGPKIHDDRHETTGDEDRIGNNTKDTFYSSNRNTFRRRAPIAWRRVQTHSDKICAPDLRQKTSPALCWNGHCCPWHLHGRCHFRHMEKAEWQLEAQEEASPCKTCGDLMEEVGQLRKEISELRKALQCLQTNEREDAGRTRKKKRRKRTKGEQPLAPSRPEEGDKLEITNSDVEMAELTNLSPEEPLMYNEADSPHPPQECPARAATSGMTRHPAEMPIGEFLRVAAEVRARLPHIVEVPPPPLMLCDAAHLKLETEPQPQLQPQVLQDDMDDFDGDFDPFHRWDKNWAEFCDFEADVSLNEGLVCSFCCGSFQRKFYYYCTQCGSFACQQCYKDSAHHKAVQQTDGDEKQSALYKCGGTTSFSEDGDSDYDIGVQSFGDNPLVTELELQKAFFDCYPPLEHGRELFGREPPDTACDRPEGEDRDRHKPFGDAPFPELSSGEPEGMHAEEEKTPVLLGACPQRLSSQNDTATNAGLKSTTHSGHSSKMEPGHEGNSVSTLPSLSGASLLPTTTADETFQTSVGTHSAAPDGKAALSGANPNASSSSKGRSSSVPPCAPPLEDSCLHSPGEC